MNELSVTAQPVDTSFAVTWMASAIVDRNIDVETVNGKLVFTYSRGLKLSETLKAATFFMAGFDGLQKYNYMCLALKALKDTMIITNYEYKQAIQFVHHHVAEINTDKCHLLTALMTKADLSGYDISNDRLSHDGYIGLMVMVWKAIIDKLDSLGM